METAQRKKPIQNFKYEKVLKEGRQLYYVKRCLHCKSLYQSKVQSTAFCNVRCRKAADRQRNAH